MNQLAKPHNLLGLKLLSVGLSLQHQSRRLEEERLRSHDLGARVVEKKIFPKNVTRTPTNRCGVACMMAHVTSLKPIEYTDVTTTCNPDFQWVMDEDEEHMMNTSPKMNGYLIIGAIMIASLHASDKTCAKIEDEAPLMETSSRDDLGDSKCQHSGEVIERQSFGRGPSAQETVAGETSPGDEQDLFLGSPDANLTETRDKKDDQSMVEPEIEVAPETDDKQADPDSEVAPETGNKQAHPEDSEVPEKIVLVKSKVPPPPPLKKKQKAANGNVPSAPLGGAHIRGGSSSRISRHPEVIELFHEVWRALQGNMQRANTNLRSNGSNGLTAINVASASIFSEICGNSAYLQRIKSDIAEYRHVIQDLIKRVAEFKPSNMQAVVEFVTSTDAILDRLSDDLVVLKAFEWPRRYCVLREAKSVFNELMQMKIQFISWQTQPYRSLIDELLDMEKHTNKAMQRHDAIMRDDDANTKKFREAGIPWTGKTAIEAKQASLSLLEKYMARTMTEVDKIKTQSCTQEKKRNKRVNRLTNAIRFCFKVH